MKLRIQKFITGLAMTGIVMASVFAPFIMSATGQISPAVTYANATESAPSYEDATDWSQFECWSMYGGFKFAGCTINILKVVLDATHVIVGLVGTMSDVALDLSISSDTYSKNAEFVETGWTLVRDIVNIVFILVLLIIAIGTILRIEKVSAKKLLPTLIILALVINFSLFITKVVIDAGNILSRAFIGNMEVVVKDTDGEIQETDYIQFSQLVVKQMEPQKLLAAAADQLETGKQWVLIPYMIGIIALYIYLIYIFVMISFLFIARFIGLWFLMILAPLAFVSHALPVSLPNNMDHKRWWSELANLSFQPAIFLFFMYILLQFIDMGGFITSVFSSTNKAGFVQTMIILSLPIIIIGAFLQFSYSTAKKMSGEIGGFVTKAGGAILGAGAALATGGAALAGRAAVGAAAKSKLGGRLQSKLLDREAKGGIGGKLANRALNAGDKLRSSSFDWRHTKTGGNIMKNMGMSTMGVGEMGMERSKGGSLASDKRYDEDKMKKFERFKQTGANEPVERAMDAWEVKFANDLAGLHDALSKAKDKLAEAPKGSAEHDKALKQYDVAREEINDQKKKGKIKVNIGEGEKEYTMDQLSGKASNKSRERSLNYANTVAHTKDKDVTDRNRTARKILNRVKQEQ